MFRSKVVMQKTQSSTGTNVNTSERPDNDNDQIRKPNFLFSVDYILNKAGDTNAGDTNCNTDQPTGKQYDWLYCTRFKPPKLDSKCQLIHRNSIFDKGIVLLNFLNNRKNLHPQKKKKKMSNLFYHTKKI